MLWIELCVKFTKLKRSNVTVCGSGRHKQINVTCWFQTESHGFQLIFGQNIRFSYLIVAFMRTNSWGLGGWKRTDWYIEVASVWDMIMADQPVKFFRWSGGTLERNCRFEYKISLIHLSSPFLENCGNCLWRETDL